MDYDDRIIPPHCKGCDYDYWEDCSGEGCQFHMAHEMVCPACDSENVKFISPSLYSDVDLYKCLDCGKKFEVV